MPTSCNNSFVIKASRVTTVRSLAVTGLVAATRFTVVVIVDGIIVVAASK